MFSFHENVIAVKKRFSAICSFFFLRTFKSVLVVSRITVVRDINYDTLQSDYNAMDSKRINCTQWKITRVIHERIVCSLKKNKNPQTAQNRNARGHICNGDDANNARITYYIIYIFTDVSCCIQCKKLENNRWSYLRKKKPSLESI